MPEIREITVGSAAVFNNPFESYSNLRPSVTLKVSIGADEDPAEAARDVQAAADAMLAGHKAAILARLGRENAVHEARREIWERRRRIHNGFTPDKQREDIDRIAAEFPELAEEAEEAKAAEPQGERARRRAESGDDEPFDF